MTPEYLCVNYRTDLLEECSTCCGARNSCGLYESKVDPFNFNQQKTIEQRVERPVGYSIGNEGGKVLPMVMNISSGKKHSHPNRKLFKL